MYPSMHLLYAFISKYERGHKPMDIRTRMIAARLAVRIEKDKAYSERIGIKDNSHYTDISEKKGEKDNV